MRDKTGPKFGPYQPDDEAVSPSRRRLILGMGMVSGALVLGGAKLPKPQIVDHLMSLEPKMSVGKTAVLWSTSSGVLTPQQAAMMLVAFDVLATDKTSLIRLFKLLTERLAFLTTGGRAPSVNAKLPPLDSGIMGPEIYPDNLTVTVSVGNALFDERFGLQGQKPLRLQRMTRFPNDSLDAGLCR